MKPLNIGFYANSSFLDSQFYIQYRVFIAYERVFGIWGNFVVAVDDDEELFTTFELTCLECIVADPSTKSSAAACRCWALITLADCPPELPTVDIVFIFWDIEGFAVEISLLVLEELEAVGVLNMDDDVEFRVPLGLSVLPPTGGGRGSLRLSQACRRAELGFIRVVGSHSKHRLMKSRNKGSSHPLRAV